jgi:hypothetical protein
MEKYLNSIESENEIQSGSVQYLDEIEYFCKINRRKINNLPSTGQLEYLKLQPNLEEIFSYIKHQAEKKTNNSWNVSISYKKHKDSNKIQMKFYEFLTARIYEIYTKYSFQENPEKRVKYFLEYFSDNIKMRRKNE